MDAKTACEHERSRKNKHVIEDMCRAREQDIEFEQIMYTRSAVENLEQLKHKNRLMAGSCVCVVCHTETTLYAIYNNHISTRNKGLL